MYKTVSNFIPFNIAVKRKEVKEESSTLTDSPEKKKKVSDMKGVATKL